MGSSLMDEHNIDPEKVFADALAEEDEPPPLPTGGVIHFSLKTPAGRREGDFTWELPLSVKAQTQIARRASQLRGNMPPEALDAAAATLIHRAAYLSVALVETPKWATGIEGLLDLYDEIVHRLYEEVAGHEARFRGACRATPSGSVAGA